MKKILIVDDSALMRKVISDIISQDDRFSVADVAKDGLEALNLLRENKYDGVVLDVNMPKMDGIQLLKALKDEGIKPHIMMASTVTKQGAQITMEALELGAMDFVHKPEWSYKCKEEGFANELLDTLYAVCIGRLQDTPSRENREKTRANLNKVEEIARKQSSNIKGERIVAIAISTGGPKSLQSVIPFIPGDINAPITIVQHMPVGFTKSLADRLNSSSNVTVVEAEEGDILKKGVVYLSKGGFHMNLVRQGGNVKVHYTDEPSREGVKPCANYMFESLTECDYDEVVCVVMTGMGADGTEGIVNLKKKKKIFCITQESNSCVVYGMPKAAEKAGVSDMQVPLGNIAQEIILRVGVKKNGR